MRVPPDYAGMSSLISIAIQQKRDSQYRQDCREAVLDPPPALSGDVQLMVEI